MPCNNRDHEHAWPEEGEHELVIEACETHCGWCKYKTEHANNLRVHARRHVANQAEMSLRRITIGKGKAGRKRVQMERRRPPLHVTHNENSLPLFPLPSLYPGLPEDKTIREDYSLDTASRLNNSRAITAPFSFATHQSSTNQSPRPIDIDSFRSGLESIMPPGTVALTSLSTSMPTMGLSLSIKKSSVLGNHSEEIIWEPQMSNAGLRMTIPDQQFGSRSPTSSSQLEDVSLTQPYHQLETPCESHETLIQRFDKYVCGILSVKDGPTENPWRTLILPLAKDSPALHHAIMSMAAFQASKETQKLREYGMDHLKQSNYLLIFDVYATGLVAAIATRLVLALSESWYQDVSTGFKHLRIAKILIEQVLSSHKKENLQGYNSARVRFFCNTWIYMDAISRLTSMDNESMDDDNDMDFENVLAPFNTSTQDCMIEIDPLMGCAFSLFPLIGKITSLFHKVKRTKPNSTAIIVGMSEVKSAIYKWRGPLSATIKRPEDPTCEVGHAIRTAEAYRFATLLCLDQVFSQRPYRTDATMAERVLELLATIPLSSRLVMVHIYPLLVAGCEAYKKEDRRWVEERWKSLARRKGTQNIDRCWEVTQEVWSRRDLAVTTATENQKQKDWYQWEFDDLHRGINYEVTVISHLHWVNVMKDWGWEVALY